MGFTSFRVLAAPLAILAMAGTAAPVLAQDAATAERLRKVEGEVRALQRKVFPGGDGRFFEPQITPAQPTGSATNVPSTTAVTDILARLDALESQIARLTSQTEENTNSIAQLRTRLAALEVTTGAAATLPVDWQFVNDPLRKQNTCHCATPCKAVSAPGSVPCS